MVTAAKRIQVNGHLEPQWVARICDRYQTHTIITQHNSRNLWLLAVDAPNHAVLVDGSGGSGTKPRIWERPQLTDKPVGFAGGLGPDNLTEELPKIAAVADNRSWCDMETGLRDEDDWFSVEKAHKALLIWDAWKRMRERATGG